MAEDNSIKYNLAVLGPGTVGKSALIQSLINGKFIEDYDATISDEYKCSISIGGTYEVAKILDTAGQENFSYLRKQWLENRNGVLLVFSIDNAKSFNEMKEILDDVLKQKGKDFPVLVCGNKMDLEVNRQVMPEKATKELNEFKQLPYFETSAKTGKNVNFVFEELCKMIKPRIVTKKKKGCRIL